MRRLIVSGFSLPAGRASWANRRKLILRQVQDDGVMSGNGAGLRGGCLDCARDDGMPGSGRNDRWENS